VSAALSTALSADICSLFVGDVEGVAGVYGNGYAALVSPVKSTAEYSFSLDSRW
ncbi:MAG: hypothetical protein QOF88_3787, partial [Mycobacterium sp.]|nr:hypothetical protein [Mycobacterium sp.]